MCQLRHHGQEQRGHSETGRKPAKSKTNTRGKVLLQQGFSVGSIEKVRRGSAV